MMGRQEEQDWPNRRTQILASTVPIGFLSTLFLIWRVVYGTRNKRKLLTCDYLLVLATVRAPLQRYSKALLSGD
jgi:hypothetical protein